MYFLTLFTEPGGKAINRYVKLKNVFRTHNHKECFMGIDTYSNMAAQLTGY